MKQAESETFLVNGQAVEHDLAFLALKIAIKLHANGDVISVSALGWKGPPALVEKALELAKLENVR